MRKMLIVGIVISTATVFPSCGGSSSTTATSGPRLPPSVAGQGVAQARTTLIDAGYKVAVKRVWDQSKAGTLVGQGPAPWLPAPKGTTVRLSVSRGPTPPKPYTAKIVPHKSADWESQGFDVLPVTNEARIANN